MLSRLSGCCLDYELSRVSFGKPASTHRVNPEGMLFRDMLYCPTADASSHHVVPCMRPAVLISTLIWLAAVS
jgi:hypothetical protein